MGCQSKREQRMGLVHCHSRGVSGEVEGLFVYLLLFYAIATAFQLNHDGKMMYEKRRRNPKPTLLPTQENFNFPHHIGLVWEELAFDDTTSYTQQENGLQHC